MTAGTIMGVGIIMETLFSFCGGVDSSADLTLSKTKKKKKNVATLKIFFITLNFVCTKKIDFRFVDMEFLFEICACTDYFALQYLSRSEVPCS